MPFVGTVLPFVVALLLVVVGLLLGPVARDVNELVLADAANGNMGDWLLGAQQPARWLVTVGVALALSQLVRLVVARAKFARLASWTALAAVVLLALVTLRDVATSEKRHELPGVGTVWCLDDDMMITLRYAQNLAAGHGLVWNAGERVEGITNLLWALVLAVPHWFLSPEFTSLAAIAIDAALLAAAIALLFALVRRLGGSPVAASLAGLALATHMATLHWAAAGSETTLLSVLLLVVANVAVRPTSPTDEAPSSRAMPLAAIAGGLAFATRPDALPVVLVLLAAIVVPRLRDAATRGSGVRTLVAFAAVPAAVELFRLAYYGSLVPNTYWLKMTGWSGRTLAGLEYLLRVLAQQWPYVAASVAALLLASRRRGVVALVVALFVHLGYVAYAGGDELPRQRFFVPVAPLAIGLAVAGVEELARRVASARATSATTSLAPTPLWLPWSLVAVAGLGGAIVPDVYDPLGVQRGENEATCALLGYVIRANTQPDAKVAHFWAGATPYFSQRYAIDLLGKCDATIAHEEAKPFLLKPGHNKFDFAHSFALEPDVVVGGTGGTATLEMLRENYLVRSRPLWHYQAFAEIYRDPRFAGLFVRAAQNEVGAVDRMPQLVGGAGTKLPPEIAGAIRGFHSIFVRSGTSKATSPAAWVAPSRGNGP
jgi:hypothetical protein